MGCRTTPVTLAPARSAGVASVAKQSATKVEIASLGRTPPRTDIITRHATFRPCGNSLGTLSAASNAC